jgi:hypothetical protein
LLREVIGFTAESPMEFEVGNAMGAAYGAKDPRKPGSH